jgi:drug/metabolite transporter (DMT)-like permease
MLSFYREGIACLIMIGLTYIGVSKWKKVEKKDIALIVAMGIISGIANTLMFKTFSILPLGIASFLIFSSSTISSWLIGLIYFKEKISNIILISLFLVLLGIFIMFKIDITTLNINGIIMGICFGICISIFSSIAKNISQGYGILQVYTISAGITSIFALIMAFFFHESFPIFSFSIEWFWFGVFVISTIFANGLYLLSLNNIDMSIIGIVNPFQSVITSIAGILIFQELLQFNTIIGGVLIIIATLIPYIKERYFDLKSNENE